MHRMDAFDHRAVFFRRCQCVDDMDAFDNQHIVFQLHFSGRNRGQFLLACIDFARFQRATKGAGQSAAGSRDNVIKCRGVRL